MQNEIWEKLIALMDNSSEHKTDTIKQIFLCIEKIHTEFREKNVLKETCIDD
jgi:hypothetical protein